MQEPNRNTMRDTAAIVLMAVTVTFGCAGGLLLIVRPGQVQVAAQPPLSPAAPEYSQRDAPAEPIPSAVPPDAKPRPPVGAYEYELNGQFNGQVTALATTPPLVENGYEVVGPTSRKPDNPHPGQRFLDTDLDTYSIYNGTSWLSVNTSAGVGVLDDVGDVTITSAGTGDFLGWDGTAWADINIVLDSLNDVAITSPVVKHTLRHNGSGWVNSQLAATDLSDINFTSLADADIASYDSGTSKWVNESVYENQRIISVTDYGAVPNDATADTAEIQAAIDAAEAIGNVVVWFPRGEYRSTNLSLEGEGVALIGYGASILQHATLGTADGAAVLRITGNHCLVEGLEFDGNVAATIAGKNRCIQINGTNAGTGTGNKLKNLYLHDTYNDTASDTVSSTADTIQIINGTDNRVEGCYSLRAGWNGIRVSGDGNYVVGNIVEDYLGRGIRFNGGESGWVTDNVVKTSGIASGSALLTDPEDTQFGTWYCERNRVYIKSERVFDVGGEGTNAIKVARTKHAVLRDNEIEIGLDTYSTGTVVYDHTGGANERQLTLTSGTWPTWAKLPGRIFINNDWYSLDTRVSDSIVTLRITDNPGSDVSSTTFFAEQDYDNIGIRLEDANDHVEIYGGRTDQILMTNGLMSGAITAHADNGDGKVRFTQTAHGWTSGDDGRIVYVTGSSVLEYNTKHVFKYVSANTWDSVDDEVPDNPMSRDYVAGTIGSAKAHGATDILTVRGVHFGRDKLTKFSMMENIKARVFDIEGCVFDGRHDEQYLDDDETPFDPDNEGGANGAIEWAMPDNAYDSLRIVNNEFIGAHAGANCRLVSLEDNTTQMMLAGKMIAHSNRVRNIGNGGAALMCLTTGNVSRAQLFATNGENPNEFRGTAAPTAGTWVEGQRVINTAPGVGSPSEWIYKSSGWRWSDATLASTVNVSTDDGTAKNLLAYSLPAGVMARTGDRISMVANVQFFNDAVTKRLRLLYGATSMWDTGDIASGAFVRFEVRAEFVRIADGTVQYAITFEEDGTDITEDAFTQGGATTWDAGTTLIIEGDAGAGANAGEIELRFANVTFTPAP